MDPPTPTPLPCPECGYDRTGLGDDRPCPECGYALPPGVTVVWGFVPGNSSAARWASWAGLAVFVAYLALTLGPLKARWPGWLHTAVLFIALFAQTAMLAWERWFPSSIRRRGDQLWLSSDGFAIRHGIGAVKSAPVTLAPWNSTWRARAARGNRHPPCILYVGEGTLLGVPYSLKVNLHPTTLSADALAERINHLIVAHAER